jgi:uncharacterized protein
MTRRSGTQRARPARSTAVHVRRLFPIGLTAADLFAGGVSGGSLVGAIAPNGPSRRAGSAPQGRTPGASAAGGARVESLFLQSLADGDFTPVDLTTSADFARMADLVNTYESIPLGTTDASVVTVAERLGLTDVATLDRRHFTVVRPRHVDALTLLP